ncbi:MAG: riboflavin biosynthesis protein RibF [Deltaproteobacteria bacterium]|nr:MAG: riboflavin biosynthesis protein RibF [Deltaproteobacteria bacterium]
MRLIKDLNELKEPLKNPVLTIGNFDGVHKGHLALFEKLKQRASEINGESAVMTFDPHPIKVMRPENAPPLITPIHQKIKLIEQSGIDVLFCLPFTREFSRITAREFVEDILVGKIGIKELVVGYDYSFGKGREGDIGLLKELGNHFNYRVHVVGPVKVGENLVSSTSIRNLVAEGCLEEARVLLGRHYEVSGTVIKGKNRGARLLGFPTANLKLIDELTPKRGVYAVYVLVNGEKYQGVTNIGYNPTFGNGAFSVETHLLDFQGDLLGKTIRIQFIARLRDERTFENAEALAEQIRKDIDSARTILGSV